MVVVYLCQQTTNNQTLYTMAHLTTFRNNLKKKLYCMELKTFRNRTASQVTPSWFCQLVDMENEPELTPDNLNLRAFPHFTEIQAVETAIEYCQDKGIELGHIEVSAFCNMNELPDGQVYLQGSNVTSHYY